MSLGQQQIRPWPAPQASELWPRNPRVRENIFTGKSQWFTIYVVYYMYLICTFNYYTLRTGTVQNPKFFFVPTIHQTPTSRHSFQHWISVVRVQDRHLPTMQGVSNCGTAQGQTLVKKGKSSKWRVTFFMGIFMGARERERDIYIYIIFIYLFIYLYMYIYI